MATEGSQGDASRFGAAGSALGYLFQVDLALCELMHRIDDDPTIAVTLEVLDDIVFDDDGEPTERLQAKHHVSRTASLADASPDLWRTINVWSQSSGPSGNSPALFIVTTATAAPGSIAARLRAHDRDEVSTLSALEAVARTSTNAANARFYEAFLTLSPGARRELVARITVNDAAPHIDDLNETLLRQLRRAAPEPLRQPLLDRLVGWWRGRAITHLARVARGQADRITGEEFEETLHDLREQLAADNLPADYSDLPGPSPEDVEGDARVFVQQLRLIKLGAARTTLCVHDHNRSAEQRSRWLRDGLLLPGELSQYDSQLTDEWQHHFTPLTDDPDEATDEQLEQLGRERFERLDTSDL